MPERSLTREEARRRAALLRVERYDVDVDVTGLADGPAWRATSRVRFRCAEPGADTFVDCVAEVRSATLNGVPLPAEAVAEGRIRLVDLAPDNELVVQSVQEDTSSRQGIQRNVDPADGLVYVWTSFEPDEARRAWACFDQPDLKAPHAFTVLAPADWSVASNRPADSVADEGPARRWTFPDTPPLSTYVVVVNAGPFHEVREQRGGHDIGFYCRRSLAAVLDRDAEELFATTVAGLAFFGERFGQPFGQSRYDTVFIPDMPGAMENWGCVTWGDFSLFRSAPTPRERAFRAEILLHEMAHMWFGDLVTMTWWDDLWLNESFAEWAAMWACSAVTEFTDTWATFLALRKSGGYASDRAPTRHPIRQRSRDVAQASASFDAITYAKGASVLKQLVALLGEDVFLSGLRDYFTRHAWSNTSLGDLVGALERASGRDLQAWVEGWLDRSGTDRLRLLPDATGWVLHAEGPDGDPPRVHRLDVGVYERTGAGWRRRALVPVETAGERTEVTGLDVPVGRVLLLPNDEDLTFASTRPDPESTRLLLAGAGGLPSAMSRAVVTSTFWDLLAHGETTTADYVRVATTAVRDEHEAAVAEVVLRQLVSAVERWAPADRRRELTARVAAVAVELAARAPLRDLALRALARTATSDAELEAVRAQAGDDVELAWLLLTRQAELGRYDEGAVAELRRRDPDPDSAFQALTVRAAVPEAAAKDEVWQAVFEARSVPPDRILDLGPAFWRPGQEWLLADYVRRYLDALPRLEGGMMSMMATGRAFFPVTVDDPAEVRDLEAAASDDQLSPVLRRGLTEGIDGLRRMLRARGAG